MARPKLSFLSPRPKPPPVVLAPLPDAGAPDLALIREIGLEECIRWKILPWQTVGGGIVIYASAGADLARLERQLARFGACFFTLAAPHAIRAAQLAHLAAPLRDLAEEKTPPSLSVRGLTFGGLAPWLTIGGLALLATLLWAPLTLLICALAFMTGVLLCTTAFRGAALLASRLPQALAPEQISPVQWPVISVLVPLLHEGRLVATLIDRLCALDYPPERYDLCLIVEEDDHQTRHVLQDITLPAHAQVIIVPKGRLRTKPRALNYALPFTRGTIVGIYDAEDRPARDQLQRMASHFAQAHPKVVCLQGQLDYYNDRSNWLARCFTLEYCAWFRVVLPGLARLGLPVPLGGTSLFFRRQALHDLGGWDAHNVTEDADLGIRIARFGYRTEIIPTITEEEANARPWAWVKQRSRWFKGYALTWAVHMRAPRALLRDLGWRGFIGLQLTLLGALLTFLGAPVLWLFGLLSLFAHHLLPAWPPWAYGALAAIYAISWLTDIATQILGVRRAGKDRLIIWAPTTYLYFPLATIAAWRALVQALRDPFTWEKTEHGIFAEPAAPLTADPPKPAPVVRQASGG